MADLIPFPRLFGHNEPRHPGTAVDAASSWIGEYDALGLGAPCANGMPGHPPCRSPAELERLLRAQSDTTACREGG